MGDVDVPFGVLGRHAGPSWDRLEATDAYPGPAMTTG
jgi:hypothetical protein